MKPFSNIRPLLTTLSIVALLFVASSVEAGHPVALGKTSCYKLNYKEVLSVNYGYSLWNASVLSSPKWTPDAITTYNTNWKVKNNWNFDLRAHTKEGMVFRFGLAERTVSSSSEFTLSPAKSEEPQQLNSVRTETVALIGVERSFPVCSVIDVMVGVNLPMYFQGNSQSVEADGLNEQLTTLPFVGIGGSVAAQLELGYYFRLGASIDLGYHGYRYHISGADISTEYIKLSELTTDFRITLGIAL